MSNTARFQCTEQLFVCYGEGVAVKALSMKRLASWLCECISQAYRQVSKGPPLWSECIPHMAWQHLWPVWWGECRGHMYSGVLFYASLGHEGLLFKVCAHRCNYTLASPVIQDDLGNWVCRVFGIRPMTPVRLGHFFQPALVRVDWTGLGPQLLC